MTRESVSYVPATSVNLLSLRTIQANQKISLYATDVRLLGGRLIFLIDKAGARLSTTRLNPAPHPIPYARRTGVDDPANSPPYPPCTGTCGDAAGKDADILTHATIAGGDGSGSPIGSGRVPPV